MLVAHRGGSRLAPENTLEAFSRAVDLWGADMLEMDVRLTRDGVPVVIHDETVDRTTDGQGPVAGFSLAELRGLDAGYRFVDPAGVASWRGKGVRIPTLDEVLDRFRTVWLNVESKAADAAEPIVRSVRGHEAGSRVLIAAEYERMRIGARGYAGPWGASRHHVLLFLASCALPAWAGYVPAADILQVPERWRGHQIVTPRFIERAHRANLPVQVWTVDEAADMERLLGWGVDGIQTDRPDVLARVLHERVGRPLPSGLRPCGGEGPPGEGISP